MFVRAEKAIVRLHSCKSNAFRHKDKTNMTLCQSVFSFFNDARTATCVVSTGMTSTRLRSIGRHPISMASWWFIAPTPTDSG